MSRLVFQPILRTYGQCGQAAIEFVLMVSLLVLAWVLLPNSAIEQLLSAVQTRYLSVTHWIAQP